MLILIGFCGYKGSGKSTAANLLSMQLSLREYNEVYHTGFADAVKQELAKELQVDTEWIETRKNIPKIRKLIQEKGTEEGRHKNENIWIDILHEKVKKLYKPTDALYKMVILISDVRFPNEAEWIRKHDGLLFRVERSFKIDGNLTKHEPKDIHESEKYADSLRVDGTLHNDNTIIKLQNDVRNIFHSIIKPHYKLL